CSRGRYATAGRIQNTAVVGFTSIPTRPAASAATKRLGCRLSRQSTTPNAKPTAPAVARYSIIDVRLQTSANGVKVKTTTAPTPLTGPATGRTSPQSRSAVRTKQARHVRRRAVSSATPAAIGTVARAWKSGNSNGASKGSPKTGSFG